MKKILFVLMIAITLSSCMLDYPDEKPQETEIHYCSGCETTVTYEEQGVGTETTSCPGHIADTNHLN